MAEEVARSEVHAAPTDSISGIILDRLDSYSARLFGSTGTGLAGLHWVNTSHEAQSMLTAAWAVFRTGVASWGDDGLLVPLGPAWGPYSDHTNLALALHAQREVIHHGSEIALLRDLYAAR